jgi:hypothetical protein
MTLERFSRIVDDPNLLRTITYEELKTLAIAYPYAHNLRYFLAIKARQTDHPDVVKVVASAAAYSLDRSQLFRLVAPQMVAPQEVWIEEEVLELKPIETLKRKLEEELSALNQEKTVDKSVAEAAVELPINDSIVPEKEKFSAALPENETSEEVFLVQKLPQIPHMTFDTWINKFNLLPISNNPQPEEIPRVEPVQNTQIVQGSHTQSVDYQDDVEDDSEEVGSQAEPVKTQGIAQILAEKSVAENKDVISETLAKLYAKQGYRDKAIIMYERLSLAFPEKSAYFAAEIDKLKK